MFTGIARLPAEYGRPEESKGGRRRDRRKASVAIAATMHEEEDPASFTVRNTMV